MRDYGPQSLLLLDKDENGLFEVALDLRENSPTPLVEVMADIRRAVKLSTVFISGRRGRESLAGQGVGSLRSRTDLCVGNPACEIAGVPRAAR